MCETTLCHLWILDTGANGPLVLLLTVSASSTDCRQMWLSYSLGSFKLISTFVDHHLFKRFYSSKTTQSIILFCRPAINNYSFQTHTCHSPSLYIGSRIPCTRHLCRVLTSWQPRKPCSVCNTLLFKDFCCRVRSKPQVSRRGAQGLCRNDVQILYETRRLEIFLLKETVR
jgi:hypothetical protein